MRKLLATLALLSFMAFPAMAEQFKGEFHDMCTMGLAGGKQIKTDCSVNEQLNGKTYCFGSKDAMAEFNKDPEANMKKAQDYYDSLSMQK